MTFLNYIKQLIKANSGDSSKSFLLVSVTLASLALLGICGFSLIVDVIVNGHILTDLIGMAAFVGSISTLLGAVGLTKVYGEKFDYQIYKDMKHDSSDIIVSSNEPSAKISSKEADKAI